eukprot:UN01218
MSETKTPLDEVKQQYEEFVDDANKFWNRSTKYTEKEYAEQLKRTVTALAVLGIVGYVVKLVCLPVVSSLVGA